MARGQGTLYSGKAFFLTRPSEGFRSAVSIGRQTFEEVGSIQKYEKHYMLLEWKYLV
jgi:hypothetical protein